MMLTIDIETFSDVDLGNCGLHKYAESDAFEILLVGYAYDSDDVLVCDLTETDAALPESLIADLFDPAVTKVAHNAAFEITCLSRYLGRELDPKQWVDTAVLAAVCGLPRSLDGACKALEFGEDAAKDAKGKALIKLFSCPRKPTKRNSSTRVMPSDNPEKWQTYIEYNRQDVVAERELYRRLCKFLPDEAEHDFWVLDQKINSKGMRFDRELAESAVAIDRENKDRLIQQAVELTGMDNPNSVAQIKEWLAEQEGVKVLSLNKKVIADVEGALKTDAAKQFLDLRAEISKSSTKKYDAMLRSGCFDNHIRGCFLFYGASRTGRFAGRLVQLQNIKANDAENFPLDEMIAARRIVKTRDLELMKWCYGGVSDTLSELVRTALIPEEGHRFVVADFSSIEARVLSFLAGEKWRLEAFRNGDDIYCASASQMFKVPVEKHGQNAHLRKKGKIAELACGYGGGVAALKAFGADRMGMTDEEMSSTVAHWREASPRICQLWRDIEKAAARCIVKKQRVVSPIGNTAFDYEDGILWMYLPSGRRIAYYGAEYKASTRNPERKVISYMGQDQQTKKWVRLETWGGKLTENLVQATARDCLREAMMNLDREGWDIRAHVHDEVICTEPIGGRGVAEMVEVMTRVPSWAEGLPLNADGYECPFYYKD